MLGKKESLVKIKNFLKELKVIEVYTQRSRLIVAEVVH